ncbi:hypothetical protein MRB53_023171 [Persea americana]|uniref:Uncharacterized protein n=1 Tax=Persea americana TaxID=3435 RepID=A0ACC2L9W5_PERAE|nr:hypothetical protein MRB53_023171 [Persea americana]
MDAADPALLLRLQVWTPSQQPSPSQFLGSWFDTTAIPVETISEQPSPSEFHGIWQTGTSIPIDVTTLLQQPFPCDVSYPTEVLQKKRPEIMGEIRNEALRMTEEDGGDRAGEEDNHRFKQAFPSFFRRRRKEKGKSPVEAEASRMAGDDGGDEKREDELGAVVD